MRDYYELLEIEPTASADDVKRAFRRAIARYHPDKVQHLGKEFQELAVVRAAELTEVYRTLSNPTRRAEYDELLRSATAQVAQAPLAAQPAAATDVSSAQAETLHGEAGSPGEDPQAVFSSERATRDELVRRAALARFRHALQTELGSLDGPPAQGFDLSTAGRQRRFGRLRSQSWIGARFVDRVDAGSVQETWRLAAKTQVNSQAEMCVFLMGADLAPARELAEAIAAERRRPQRAEGPKLTLVPLDVRDWQALIPTDAPPIVRAVVGRLRS